MSGERPDPAHLVEEDHLRLSLGTPGWYLDPTSSGTRERYWTGDRWDGRTRGSGPMRRWFRGLSTDQQHLVYFVFFCAATALYLYTTRNIDLPECQYGGGRFDHTC